jgi:peptidoglycan/LPS O-acetylase OafA/YrhL
MEVTSFEGGAISGFVLCFGCAGLLGTAFWVWMLVDCAMNEPSDSNDKIVWILILVFTGIIGAVLYYFVRRPRREIEAAYGSKYGQKPKPKRDQDY